MVFDQLHLKTHEILESEKQTRSYQNVWPQVFPLAPHPACNVSNMASLPGFGDGSAHFAMRHLDHHSFLHEREVAPQTQTEIKFVMHMIAHQLPEL